MRGLYFYKSIDIDSFGQLFIVCDEEALVSVDFFEEDLKSFQPLKWEPEHPICLLVEKQLLEYFNNERITFDLPIRIQGTEFQRQVWDALKNIPYGTLQSYKDVAVAINNPKAVRAVGQANRRNPIPIVVPCHRVIGHNKKLVGYAGNNVHLKERLLEIEGIQL